MAIFNSYIKLPEGMFVKNHICSLMIYNDLMTMIIICAHDHDHSDILSVIYNNDDDDE